MSPIDPPVLKRFWAKVNKTDTCWNWTASIRHNGYGQFRFGKRMRTAHRHSYEIHFGPIPENLFVCHRCDNRKCVNPEHLFLGTHKDNMIDKVRKGRQHHPDGERNGLSKLTEAQVREIREIRKNTGMLQADIAKMFSISKNNISTILSGKSWKRAD